MSDDFPNLRRYMRDRNNQIVEQPEPTGALEEIAKQLRIANLIAYAQFMPRSGRQHDALVEIEEGHPSDPILIVTLHGTIDALLGLLRVAVNNPGCETDEEVALANAILGDRT